MSGAKPPSLAGAKWLVRPETQHVLQALADGGFAARIVGGAVRNALLARAVSDIDIATAALPEQVIRLVSAAGLEAVPTGIEHGTITVVANHVPYEVTTLRKDVSTDGRRATVAFTTDWTEDAARRDFTINALYCDQAGIVFDPLEEGLADLAARRVRFIGNARDRLIEDRLRILRFFRFSAEYATGPFDAQGLDACALERSGIKQLSGERLRAELLKLLTAPRALEAVTLMEQRGILQEILEGTCHTATLSRLIEIEKQTAANTNPVRRLAALAVTSRADAERVSARLRLSAQESVELVHALADPKPFLPATPELEARAFLYRHGLAAYTNAALLTWARSDAVANDPKRHSRLTLPERWLAPALPVRGADVLDLGVPPGPEVGRIIAGFESWWIAEDFPRDAAKINAKLQALVRGY